MLATVATPTVNPNGGSYSGPVTVQLACATAGAAIHYTTDGTTPTGGSPTYSAAFQLAATATVKAIATKTGMTTSTMASVAFTITGSTPYGLDTRPAVTPINVPANLGTNPPGLLSQTGVFSNTTNLTPSAGVIPYDVNSPLWSDGANKTRLIALPGASKITFSATGEWTFPSGTVLIKTFVLNTKRLETRLLVLNGANAGYGITYKWNSAQTDAELMGPGTPSALSDGLDENQGSQTWRYPSRGECLTCHTTNAQFVLGPKTRQLNGSFTYPATGRSDNQLRTWNYLQMFTTNIGEGSIASLTRSKALTDTSATLEDRVKSYLDSNCAQCHRPGGVATQWDGRYDTPMANQLIIDGPVKTNLGITGAAVVVMGSTSRSAFGYSILP